MTNALVKTETNLPSAFAPEVFADFVAWIDRSAKTTKTYLANLKQFAAWMRYAKVANPTRSDILAYRDWLLSEHYAIAFDSSVPEGFRYRLDGNGRRIKIECKPTTVSSYIRSVVQFFRWGSSIGICPDITTNVHAPKIRQDFHRKDALTPSDVLSIETSIDETNAARIAESAQAFKDTEGRTQRATEQGARIRAMYLLAVTAGLRCIELSRAKVRDFHVIDGRPYLMVWGKGHNEADHRKALAPEVATAIREYLKLRQYKPTANTPLFVSTGNRSGGSAIASTTISKMLKKAMQNAGYDSDRLTAHSLRHTAGNCVQKLTHDLYETQLYMRHSSPKTTEIYLHCEDEVQESALAERLFAYYHGKTIQADALPKHSF